jgi:hypothetical protein
MLDLFGMLAARQRPALLVEAARRGSFAYRRANHLRRLLGSVPRSGEAIVKLLDLEAAYEAQRRGGEAHYAVTRHLEVMIAILGEMRHLRATRPVLVAA